MKIRLALAALAIALSAEVHAFALFHGPEGQVYSWPGGVVRWRIATGAPPMLRESMLAATEQWAEASGWAVSFQEDENAPVVVYWDWDGSRIGHSTFLGMARFHVYDGSSISEAEVIINGSTYDWYRGGGGVDWKPGKKMLSNLDGVLLHELGHVLGINHATVGGNEVVGGIDEKNLPTMWPTLQPGSETLHIDDVAAVRALYPGGSTDAWSPKATQSLSIRLLTLDRKVGPLRMLEFEASGALGEVEWDFGDGKVATGQLVKHRYRRRGYYEVVARSGPESATLLVRVKFKKPK
jgi:hypothetical protein